MAHYKTEKSVETIRKCKKLEKMLENKYPKCKIKMFLVCLRHLCASSIRKDVRNKYTKIIDNLVGVNEYLRQLGISQQHELENEENYKIFINKFVRML